MINNVAVLGEIPMPSGEMNVIEGQEAPQALNLNGMTSTTGIVNLGVNNSSTWLPNTYYPTWYPTYYQSYKQAWVSIEKADNGFIVMKDGKTFVCKTITEISKLLEEKKNGKT